MKETTILSRLKNFIDQYRARALVLLGTSAAFVLIASEVFPEAQEYLTKSNIVSLLTLIIVIDIAYAINTIQLKESLHFASNQDEALEFLLPLISDCTQADLIEYAGSTPLPIIRQIQRERIPIRILVKHPDTLQGLQKSRSITTLDTLYNSVFKDHTGDYEIRCYRLPFSLRGRHLHGKILELGWLTPDYKNQTAFGHSNPTTLIDLPDKRNEYLLDFFNRTFSDYWNHTDTEDGHNVLQSYKLT